MTVNELIKELNKLKKHDKTWGNRTVRMGDPRTQEYVEATGLWIPADEAVVDLEAVEWEPWQNGKRKPVD